jgi:hypothetical protein
MTLYIDDSRGNVSTAVRIDTVFDAFLVHTNMPVSKPTPKIVIPAESSTPPSASPSGLMTPIEPATATSGLSTPSIGRPSLTAVGRSWSSRSLFSAFSSRQDERRLSTSNLFDEQHTGKDGRRLSLASLFSRQSSELSPEEYDKKNRVETSPAQGSAIEIFDTLEKAEKAMKGIEDRLDLFKQALKFKKKLPITSLIPDYYLQIQSFKKATDTHDEGRLHGSVNRGTFLTSPLDFEPLEKLPQFNLENIPENERKDISKRYGNALKQAEKLQARFERYWEMIETRLIDHQVKETEKEVDRVKSELENYRHIINNGTDAFNAPSKPELSSFAMTWFPEYLPPSIVRKIEGNYSQRLKLMRLKHQKNVALYNDLVKPSLSDPNDLEFTAFGESIKGLLKSSSNPDLTAPASDDRGN